MHIILSVLFCRRLGLLSQQENSETFTRDGRHGPSGDQLAVSTRQQNKDSIAGVSVLGG